MTKNYTGLIQDAGGGRDCSEWCADDNSSRSGFKIHKIVGRNGWSFHEHAHRGFCEFVCATEGRFRHAINGQAFLQEEGDLVLVRETDWHELGGRDFVYVNVMFTTDWLLRLESFVQFAGLAERLLRGECAPRAAIPANKRAEWAGMLEQLLANGSTSHGRRLFARFLLSMVVDRLAPVDDLNLPANVPDWLRRAIDWLGENRGRVPDVAELVKHGGRSHEHFTRQFTRHLGVSPSRYLADLRVDRAADLLATTNYKLLDICHAVGFENEGYFYRSFRQRKGVTPLAFRRAHGSRSIQPRKGIRLKAEDC
jgi:AraC-like DNA-binding protein